MRASVFFVILSNDISSSPPRNLALFPDAFDAYEQIDESCERDPEPNSLCGLVRVLPRRRETPGTSWPRSGGFRADSLGNAAVPKRLLLDRRRRHYRGPVFSATVLGRPNSSRNIRRSLRCYKITYDVKRFGRGLLFGLRRLRSPPPNRSIPFRAAVLFERLPPARLRRRIAMVSRKPIDKPESKSAKYGLFSGCSEIDPRCWRVEEARALS